MKVFIIMTMVTSMLQPTVPVETAKDSLDLNIVASWETDIEDDTMVLTLYTDTGDMYILEKEVNQ